MLLQYPCLENSMDRRAWWAIVHGVAKSQTWLSLYECTNIALTIFLYSKFSSVQFSCSVMSNGIPISFRIFQFIVIHTVKGFGIVNRAEIYVFLELSCFFDDPADVGNLISGSSAFSKSSLNIWKFTIHVLLKPGLENFEHYFTSMWDECNCAVVWTFFGITFLWDSNENWPFLVLGPLLLGFPN